MYLKENDVELSDSLMGFGQTVKKEFISVDNTVHDLHPFQENDFFEIFLVLDAQKDTYTRVVFNFLDLFGKLGGVFELLSIAFGLLIGFFSKNVSLNSIFKRLYHTEKDDGIDTSNKQSSEQYKIKINNNWMNEEPDDNLSVSKVNNCSLNLSLWNEDQKEISDIIVESNNCKTDRKTTKSQLNNKSQVSKELNDQSWSFDGVDQIIKKEMNLRDNNQIGDEVQSHSNKEDDVTDLK